jgi:hypothetical protein
MRAAVQAASSDGGMGRWAGEEEESIAELLAATTTRPVVVWAPIRAAGDLRGMA